MYQKQAVMTDTGYENDWVFITGKAQNCQSWTISKSCKNDSQWMLLKSCWSPTWNGGRRALHTSVLTYCRAFSWLEAGCSMLTYNSTSIFDAYILIWVHHSSLDLDSCDTNVGKSLTDPCAKLHVVFLCMCTRFLICLLTPLPSLFPLLLKSWIPYLFAGLCFLM